jgi:hypothetical protein
MDGSSVVSLLTTAGEDRSSRAEMEPTGLFDLFTRELAT